MHGAFRDLAPQSLLSKQQCFNLCTHPGNPASHSSRRGCSFIGVARTADACIRKESTKSKRGRRKGDGKRKSRQFTTFSEIFCHLPAFYDNFSLPLTNRSPPEVARNLTLVTVSLGLNELKTALLSTDFGQGFFCF